MPLPPIQETSSPNLLANENNFLIIGQMVGLAARLDITALEAFLKNPTKDFRYWKECRAAIDFKREVYKK